MQPDQIYNSAEPVTEEDIKAFFVAHDVAEFPKNYAQLMVAHNGGKVHPVVCELPNEDALFELYPITPDRFIESVEKIEFDPDESSVPATLQPSFRICLLYTSDAADE